MNIEQVNARAIELAKKALELAKTGRIKWTTAEVPKPEAMRAFMGTGAGFMLHVVQANVKGRGIIHMATMTYMPEMIIVNLPPPLDDQFYHLAAASQN